jgi:hypothetical protein
VAGLDAGMGDIVLMTDHLLEECRRRSHRGSRPDRAVSRPALPGGNRRRTRLEQHIVRARSATDLGGTIDLLPSRGGRRSQRRTLVTTSSRSTVA